jgi:hypothetical protein
VKPYRNSIGALSEIEEVAQWYEQRDIGLGGQFVLAVEAAMQQICEAPQAWPLWPGCPESLEAHRLVMKRFPYSIAYLAEPADVLWQSPSIGP